MSRIEIERLESRRLLSAMLRAQPEISPTLRFRNNPITLQPQATAGPIGLTPTQLRHAYGLDQIIVGNGIFADGTGQTITIVDAFDNPKFVSSSDVVNYATSDLYQFNQQFGLPQFGVLGGPTFKKVNQSGGTSYPTANSGWGSEIALDVEWAHALAPGANIILVEASSTSYSDLVTAAVGWARTQAGVSVVSLSFGSAEFMNESDFDGMFTTPFGHNGITFLAATGDNGSPGLYPAYSPNVVAVGGSSLGLDFSDNYSSESGWSGSGGGISNNQGREAKPSYQSSITLSNARRMIPDVSIVADPNTGVPILDSFSQGSAAPWWTVGGTSLSTPLWGAIISIANQVRGIAGLGTLNGLSQTLPTLYTMPASNFHDITSGNNGHAAGVGYDLVTGRGTPRTALIVGDLVGAMPSAPDLTAATDSGQSNTDNRTKIASPHFTGTATTGLIVQIVSDGIVVGSGTATGGNFDIVPSSPLADGVHTIVARVGARASSGLSVTIDTAAPAIVGSTFLFDANHNVIFTFSEDVSADVSQGSASIVPAGGGSLVGVTQFTYQPGLNSAEFKLPPSLPDGNYTATFPASGIIDDAGNAMAAGGVLNFFVFAADANHDRIVDIQDLSILVASWNQSGKTFSQGDFNYDGVVDGADLNLLAQRWQQTLSPPVVSLAGARGSAAPRRTANRVVDLIE